MVCFIACYYYPFGITCNLFNVEEINTVHVHVGTVYTGKAAEPNMTNFHFLHPDSFGPLDNVYIVKLILNFQPSTLIKYKQQECKNYFKIKFLSNIKSED